ncbi:MAG: ATP-binding cassette domain-containing protein [Anaeroplasma bactoclasticum]|nr:ATP-binding cassette domain-containing protein [Anaeroplasma bactoclasticum]
MPKDSGSGKSTLLNVIPAVDTYEEGEILFQRNETSYYNQNDMDMFRKNNVSFIILKGKSHEEAKKEAKEIIGKVGLSKRIHHRGIKLFWITSNYNPDEKNSCRNYCQI